MTLSTEVQRPENSLSISTNSPDSEAPLATLDLGEAIDLALKRAGFTHKQACAYMNLDQSQWSKQLKGQDNHQVSFQRLKLLPRAFWNEFLPLLGSPLQVTVASQDAADAAMLRLVTVIENLAVLTVQFRALRRIA